MKSFAYKDLENKNAHIHVIYDRALEEPVHTHDFIEIVYVASGKMMQFINGEQYESNKGDLLFIGYNSEHSFYPIGEATYYNICFYTETMEKVINEDNAFSLLALSSFNKVAKNSTGGGIISFTPREQELIEKTFETMLDEQDKGDARSEEINESLLNVIINWMIRKTSLVPETANVDIKNEISEYIMNHLDSDLSLESLAKKYFYNPSYFSRLFRTKFRIPLVEYVAKKRVEKAIQLLVDTDLSINEISNLCGFTNKTAFYRSFSKIAGKSPAEYRKENKN